MFSTSILDNTVAFVFWSLFFSNAIVFWTCRAILQKKLSPETIAARWEKGDTLKLACFLSLIMTNSHEEALLNNPRSRLIQTGFIGSFFAFLLLGLWYKSLNVAFASADHLLLANAILWILAFFLGIVQSVNTTNRFKAGEALKASHND